MSLYNDDDYDRRYLADAEMDEPFPCLSCGTERFARWEMPNGLCPGCREIAFRAEEEEVTRRAA